MHSRALICLLGAPGTGKGTQGALLASALGGQHVSVGDLVREQLAAGVRVPRSRKTRLVDTGYTVQMVVEACVKGYGPIILDGFPRHASQVDALLELPWRCRLVVNLVAPFEVALDRMRERSREGEDVARIAHRHVLHDMNAGELALSFGQRGIAVAEVDATGSIAEVHSACRAVIPISCGQVCEESARKLLL